MKFTTLTLPLALLIGSAHLHAETLSPADEQKTIEWLEALKDKISGNKTDRLSAAKSRLNSAASSEDSAFSLYMDALQKINFTDKGATGAEFATWKMGDNQKAKFSKPGFKRGLRYACQWLLLSTGVRSEEDKENTLNVTSQALSILENIKSDFSGTARMDFDDSLTGGPAGLIAQYLKIEDLKPKRWVASPINIGSVFDSMILPNLRETADIKAYRDAWTKRIDLEDAIIITPSVTQGIDIPQSNPDSGRSKDRNGRSSSPRSPQATAGGGGIAGSKGTSIDSKKVEDQKQRRLDALSDLKWQMESECFALGDEKVAVQNMMAIISAAKDPKVIERRVNDLETLLNGSKKYKERTTTDTPKPKAELPFLPEDEEQQPDSDPTPPTPPDKTEKQPTPNIPPPPPPADPGE